MIPEAKGIFEKDKENLLIAFATKKEALPTLSAFKAVAENEQLYRFDQGQIVITGMGSLAAISGIAHLPFDELLNVGFAASLKGEAVGTIVPVGQVAKLPFLPEGAYSQRFFEAVHPMITLGEGKRLMTADFPVHHKALKERLEADLIDMEGYGLAFLCRKMGKKATMWKIISDFAEEGGQALIERSVSSLAEKIAEHLWTILKAKTP